MQLINGNIDTIKSRRDNQFHWTEKRTWDADAKSSTKNVSIAEQLRVNRGQLSNSRRLLNPKSNVAIA